MPPATGLLFASLGATAVLGVARGLTTRLWIARGEILRQGGVWTVVLWLVAIGQHIAVDTLLPAGVGIATLSLFFGISLVSQVEILNVRARGLRRMLSPA